MRDEFSGNINVSTAGTGVRRIEIDRPSKRGALTTALMRDLGQHLDEAETDGSVRAVLIGSTGPAFCAGADLADLAAAPPEDDPGAHILHRLSQMTTPVVAAVQGSAVGMGATILLHCDVVYATDNASMRFPFVQLGLTPEGGATMILPPALGPARAKRVLLLGESLSAVEAVSSGLWTEIVDDEVLARRSHDAATALARLPVDVVAATKRLMRPAGFADSFDHESLVFSHQRMKKLTVP